ncbi:MAG: hypothetical protein J6C06_06745 [Lachnospiraceae bacterium]|nr:hypothetical protein [Lachnospiraceae bacterium]
MKKIDVLILYEHPERELENILLLMHELEKRKLKCELLQVPVNLFLRNKYYNKVKTVLVPYMYYNEDLYYGVYKIVGEASYIINFRWEQVLSVGVENDNDAFWYPKQEAINTKHICWGMIPYQRMLECGVQESNLFVSGALHLDFLRDKLKKYYKEKDDIYEEFGLDIQNKTILFISSFSSANLSEDRFEHLKMVMGEKEAKEFISVSVNSQKKILEWFEVLLRKGYTIIYRPHPSEIKSEFVNRYKEQYSNFKVISEYSVKQWILVSDFVLSWISTSYVEAYVANIPCGILRPVKLSENREMTVLKTVKKIDSYDKLEEFITETKDVEKNDLVEKYYQIDDQYAYIKIADYIEKIINNPKECYIWPREIVQEFSIRRKNYLKDSSRLKIVQILYSLISFFYLTESSNHFIEKIVKYYSDVKKDIEMQEQKKNNILNKEIEYIKGKLAEILD